MSPEAYSWETREAAEELYIIDGLTYEETAERTGVSTSQLKRWGTESTPSWSERRREYRQAQTSVRRGVMLAKAKLIESVIDTEDAQKAYAFASLVSSARTIDQEARERAASPAEAPTTADLALDKPTDMLNALSQALNAKIGGLLSQPGAITLTGIKELQQGLALLEKLRTRIGEETAKDNKAQGASASTIDSLREAIMKELRS